MEIRIAKINDINKIFNIYVNAKKNLIENGIFQWTENYPNLEIIRQDIKNEFLYVLSKDDEIIGAINISEEQEKEYEKIDWIFDDTKVLVIHRLVINPKNQKKGNARKLMNFAEKFATENNYSSIRLDAYSPNTRVIDFYRTREFFIRGKVNFPERNFPFYCMEKEL
ncbi:MAG: GNAT family N-acetyltransferase [Marinifilaceae bacterium]|jgi:GNAT superfamily N-acetyltransferase|nr:GNAT family N-acetyltransferase [Marinifilaceae bacterium]